jgi:hypothetical protein
MEREKSFTVAKNKKEDKRRMRAMRKIKMALVLVATLAMVGTGWAKPGFGGPGVNGDLNGNTVTVVITVPTKTEVGLCETPTTPPVGTTITTTHTLKAYIFQPSGRMFGIALGTNTFDCNTLADQQVTVALQVFPGLTLKPGPATLLYQAIETTTTTTATTTTTSTEVIYEFGSRVDLH